MTVISYRQALHDTLRAELQRDDNVFLIGEEIGVLPYAKPLELAALPDARAVIRAVREITGRS